MKETYYRGTGRKAVGSVYPWAEDGSSYPGSALCEVIPFPQEQGSPRPAWNFSRRDAVFAVALTGLVTTLICIAPAILSLIS